MNPREDRETHRWGRPDGSRLVLTARGRLLERKGEGAGLGYVQVVGRSGFGDALLYAQLHGYRGMGSQGSCGVQAEGEAEGEAEPQRPEQARRTLPLDGTRPACRHCKERVACRPKGLCWRCERDPEVRRQYPSESKYARREDQADGVVTNEEAGDGNWHVCADRPEALGGKYVLGSLPTREAAEAFAVMAAGRFAGGDDSDVTEVTVEPHMRPPVRTIPVAKPGKLE